jgi:leader peptidase (prepilin peptidase)/N-methyltransferase
MEHPRWWDGLVGGVVGYLVIRGIADGYQLLTGRMGMGYGDAKLLAMVGALLGWQALLPTLFLASFQGSIIGITVLFIAKKRRETQDGEPGSEESGEDREPEPDPEPRPTPDGAEDDENPADPADPEDDEADEDDEDLPDSIRYTRIPFGPFLSLAALEVLIFKDLFMRLVPFPW